MFPRKQFGAVDCQPDAFGVEPLSKWCDICSVTAAPTCPGSESKSTAGWNGQPCKKGRAFCGLEGHRAAGLAQRPENSFRLSKFGISDINSPLCSIQGRSFQDDERFPCMHIAGVGNDANAGGADTAAGWL
jgi:hypothetical protein